MWLIAVLGVGCKKKSAGADCKAIAGHIVEIAQTELEALPPDQRVAAAAQLPTVRSELVNRCEKSSSDFAKVAPCIMKASSKNELTSCAPELTGSDSGDKP